MALLMEHPVCLPIHAPEVEPSGQSCAPVGSSAPDQVFNYYVYHYKVDPCGLRIPHDWASCPFAHRGERAARRDLRKYRYRSVPCDYAKEKLQCPQGDQCIRAHSLYEYWLHPDRFRTELCQFGSACRRPVCFFAHDTSELRPLDPSLLPAELCWHTGASLKFGRNKGANGAEGGTGGDRWAAKHSGGAGLIGATVGTGGIAGSVARNLPPYEPEAAQRLHHLSSSPAMQAAPTFASPAVPGGLHTLHDLVAALPAMAPSSYAAPAAQPATMLPVHHHGQPAGMVYTLTGLHVMTEANAAQGSGSPHHGVSPNGVVYLSPQQRQGSGSPGPQYSLMPLHGGHANPHLSGTHL